MASEMGVGRGEARQSAGSDAASRYRVRAELNKGQVWWHMPEIPALWRRRQENRSVRSLSVLCRSQGQTRLDETPGFKTRAHIPGKPALSPSLRVAWFPVSLLRKPPLLSQSPPP